MFDYRQVRVDDESLERYARLFSACFPHAFHLTPDYLRWLYRDNPCGHVIGMDAIAGDVLAAHYVCIPADIRLRGVPTTALLSLNTATHPDFQGKGLFTKLAALTYELGHEHGFSSVYGVANANSTPGFLRKLNFQHVAKLDARIGIGKPAQIDWNKVDEHAEFRRLWSGAQLQWRMRNPANQTHAFDLQGATALYARTDRKGVIVWGETPTALEGGGSASPPLLSPRLFLGLYPQGAVKKKISYEIPDRLRPSPLNLIFRSLRDDLAINADAVSFSFMDFDAY